MRAQFLQRCRFNRVRLDDVGLLRRVRDDMAAEAGLYDFTTIAIEIVIHPRAVGGRVRQAFGRLGGFSERHINHFWRESGFDDALFHLGANLGFHRRRRRRRRSRTAGDDEKAGGKGQSEEVTHVRLDPGSLAAVSPKISSAREHFASSARSSSEARTYRRPRASSGPTREKENED